MKIICKATDFVRKGAFAWALAMLVFLMPYSVLTAHATEGGGEAPATAEDATPAEGEEGEATEGEPAEGAEGEEGIDGEGVSSEEQAFVVRNVMFVGDDTVIGMRNSAGNNDNIWVGENGKGLTWVKETAAKQFESWNDGYVYVFCVGLNEVTNTSEVEKYIEYFNQLAEDTADRNVKIYYMSVNPIDEVKYNNKLNAKIFEWNNRMKNALPDSISFIDTCTPISSSFSTVTDGFHYDEATYKTLYNMVLKVLGLQTPEEIEAAGQALPVEIKAVNGWGTDMNGIRVYYDSNEEIVKGWRTIDGGVYYFDENGHYLTGLHELEGAIRFFSPIGIMRRNDWGLVDNEGHYMLFGENGQQLFGWQTVGPNRYYIGKDGWRLTGWWTIGTRVYYFMEDGAVAKGLTFIGDNVFYFNDDGSVKVGWYEADGKRYYFGDGGKMVFGKVEIDGKTYYFRDTGEQIVGWNNEADGTRYYTEDGSMATGWQEIDGQNYYFDEGGLMLVGWATSDKGKRYFGKSGIMSTGLTVIDGATYYFNLEGYMQTGWVENTEGKRYFGDDGAMRVGWSDVDGARYYFLEDGLMQTGTVMVDNMFCSFGETGALGFHVSLTLVKTISLLLILGIVGTIAFRRREQIMGTFAEFTDVLSNKSDKPAAASADDE